MMKLLIAGSFPSSEEQMDRIASLGYKIILHRDECEALSGEAFDAEAVICNGLFFYHDIGRFKNLRFIQLTSAGMDRVPLETVREKGIRLENAGDVYSTPCAEWAVLKVLEIYKKSAAFYKAQSLRTWEKREDLLELTDKTAAIIGFGHIGQAIAKRLKAFGVKIIAVQRREATGEEASLADEVAVTADMERILGSSDIVILTLPYTAQTHHLMDSEKIAWMKDDCILVNVSRGSVIDEVALIQALLDGKFCGVALDVFEEEPLSPGSPLWTMDKVIITPHIAFVSDKGKGRLFELILHNLGNYIRESGGA